MEPNPSQAPSFEQALEQLEKIVDSMESGQVPLAELLSNFEKGTGLLQLCESRLKEAELRIDQLKKTASGASLSTFDSSESTS